MEYANSTNQDLRTRTKVESWWESAWASGFIAGTSAVLSIHIVINFLFAASDAWASVTMSAVKLMILINSSVIVAHFAYRARRFIRIVD